MTTKRTAAHAPLQMPLAEGMRLRPEWERWLGLVSEQVFRRDKYSVTINPTSVSANTTSEQAFTVNGVDAGDVVIVVKPTHTAGLGIVNARVSGTNELSITFMNATGSPIDPPSETYTIFVMKV